MTCHFTWWAFMPHIQYNFLVQGLKKNLKKTRLFKNQDFMFFHKSVLNPLGIISLFTMSGLPQVENTDDSDQGGNLNRK